MIPGLVFPCYIPFLSWTKGTGHLRCILISFCWLVIDIVNFSIIFQPNIYHDHTHFFIHLTIDEISNMILDKSQHTLKEKSVASAS